MVYEQHTQKSSNKDEEEKVDSSQPSDQDIKHIIDAPVRNESTCDYKTVLMTDIAEMMFKNQPPVNEVLKENSVMILQKLVSGIDQNSNLMPFTTGTKLKKVRCLIAINESNEQVADFDQALKVSSQFFIEILWLIELLFCI